MTLQKEGLLGQRRESNKSQGGQESNGEMNSTEYIMFIYKNIIMKPIIVYNYMLIKPLKRKKNHPKLCLEKNAFQI